MCLLVYFENFLIFSYIERQVDFMDITALATGMAQRADNSQIGVAMLSKTLDTQRMEGAQIVEMIDSAQMERSVYPHIGGNFDMSV